MGAQGQLSSQEGFRKAALLRLGGEWKWRLGMCWKMQADIRPLQCGYWNLAGRPALVRGRSRPSDRGFKKTLERKERDKYKLDFIECYLGRG